MNYKDKFLEIFSFFIKGKSLEGTTEEHRNGKYFKKEKDGIKRIIWYKNGQLHRENGAAFIRSGGGFDTIKEWYQNGLIHNDNGPAMITKSPYGKWTKEWYKDGELHRDGDDPAIINSSEENYWYKNGHLHRDHGPAIIKQNSKHWYKNGVLHREDGPAVQSPQIKGFYREPGEEWWINGKQLTKEEFNIFISYKNLDKELPNKNNDKIQGKKLKI